MLTHVITAAGHLYTKRVTGDTQVAHTATFPSFTVCIPIMYFEYCCQCWFSVIVLGMGRICACVRVCVRACVCACVRVCVRAI